MVLMALALNSTLLIAALAILVEGIKRAKNLGASYMQTETAAQIAQDICKMMNLPAANLQLINKKIINLAKAADPDLACSMHQLQAKINAFSHEYNLPTPLKNRVISFIEKSEYF